MTISQKIKEFEEKFERYYARTIGIIADDKIMNGKYAKELVENKKEFKSFLSQALTDVRKETIKEVEDKIKKFGRNLTLEQINRNGYVTLSKITSLLAGLTKKA